MNRRDFNGKFFGIEDSERARADFEEEREADGGYLDAVDVWMVMHSDERRYTYHPRIRSRGPVAIGWIWCLYRGVCGKKRGCRGREFWTHRRNEGPAIMCRCASRLGRELLVLEPVRSGGVQRPLAPLLGRDQTDQEAIEN